MDAISPIHLTLLTAMLFAATGGAQVDTGTTIGPANAGVPVPADIILLHHSTGERVWNGGLSRILQAHAATTKATVRIAERAFPAESPYGWENYPYDYWNIWVRHAGSKPYKGEPTLEMLTKKHNVIILKHCFPVSAVEADTGRADVTSNEKRAENYKLQYAALKKKMRSFPKTTFIVWTGAALIQNETDADSARRAKAFFNWVRTTWDEKGDNIHLWDFRALQTEGGLYFREAYADGDSHPNDAFSRRVAPLLARRIVDVLAGKGDVTPLTGGKPLRVAPAPTPTATSQPTVTSKPAATVPAVAPPTAKGGWIFDNAETPALLRQRWTTGAAYLADGANRVIRLDFTTGKQQDWGEYGKHRILFSRPSATPYRVKDFRYLAMRVRSDQDMQVVCGLMTLSDVSRPDREHFSFNGYVRTKGKQWRWVVFDLSRLELEVEGPAFHAKLGKPARIGLLNAIKLCAHEKNVNARFEIDDMMFLMEAPAALKPFVQGAGPED